MHAMQSSIKFENGASSTFHLHGPDAATEFLLHELSTSSYHVQVYQERRTSYPFGDALNSAHYIFRDCPLVFYPFRLVFKKPDVRSLNGVKRRILSKMASSEAEIVREYEHEYAQQFDTILEQAQMNTKPPFTSMDNHTDTNENSTTTTGDLY